MEYNPLLKLTKLYVDLTLTSKICEELEEIVRQVEAARRENRTRIYVVTQSESLDHLVKMAGFTISDLRIGAEDSVYYFTVSW